MNIIFFPLISYIYTETAMRIQLFNVYQVGFEFSFRRWVEFDHTHPIVILICTSSVEFTKIPNFMSINLAKAWSNICFQAKCQKKKLNSWSMKQKQRVAVGIWLKKPEHSFVSRKKTHPHHLYYVFFLLFFPNLIIIHQTNLSLSLCLNQLFSYF